MKKPSDTNALSAATQDIVVRSDDGFVCFKLRPALVGIWVQRERRHKDRSTRLVQSMVFFDAIGFARWCEADSVRFDYPNVFRQVKREGGVMLQNHEQLPTA
jgi:hypothetical protein